MLCDICDQENYTDRNPMVEGRCPDSSQTHLKRVVGGHLFCLMSPLLIRDASCLPEITEEGTGHATRGQWLAWLGTSAARQLGITELD